MSRGKQSSCYCHSISSAMPRAQQVLISVCACSICLLAGDISPVDVITHIPVVCEDLNVPYIYVPSKEVSIPHISS
jgi:hypothetical protein